VGHNAPPASATSELHYTTTHGWKSLSVFLKYESLVVALLVSEREVCARCICNYRACTSSKLIIEVGRVVHRIHQIQTEKANLALFGLF
jgi:hypothetical protein